MRGLDDLIRQGKVLYVGISDAPAWWIAQANTLAQLRGWSPLRWLADRVQPDRANRRTGVGPNGQGLNLGLTAFSPLAGGILTGKYHGHGSSEQGRMNNDMVKAFGLRMDQQRESRVVAAVKAVSDQTGRGMAQVALHGFATARAGHPHHWRPKASQLQDNLASFDLSLQRTGGGTRRGEPN